MGFRVNETPCHESKRCYYEEWRFDKDLDRKIKLCRILDSSKAYEDGKCHFYKATAMSYSGDYEGSVYSDEMVEKIKNNETAYKMAHGILGRKGRARL